MPSSTFSYTSADGTQIAAYRWDPASAPRAAVQITHGMGEHAQRYDHVDAYVADPRCGFGIDTDSARAMFAGADPGSFPAGGPAGQ
jgi:hypothetical protein